MEKHAQDRSHDYHAAIQSVVDHLKCKRKEIQGEINSDQEERAKVLVEMSKLQDKLTIIDANLKKKSEFRSEYDKAITQSETHFMELMQKSEDFLSKARREALALSHTMKGSGGRSCNDKILIDESKDHSGKKCDVPQVLPAAVLTIQPSGSGGCVGCSNAIPCTTVAVPYRANGL